MNLVGFVLLPEVVEIRRVKACKFDIGVILQGVACIGAHLIRSTELREPLSLLISWKLIFAVCISDFRIAFELFVRFSCY